MILQAPKVWLSQEAREDFERFSRSRTLPASLVRSAQIILRAAMGQDNQQIAAALNLCRQTVGRWRERFLADGQHGLEDRHRSGRPARISSQTIHEIVRLTTQEKPAGATHWSTRTLAPVAAVSPSTVGRIWRAHGLKPHRVKSFKLSNDSRFAEKLEDVVNLYLNPPPDAVVISADEKCQIQALDRTRPVLPLRPRIPERQTHDYIRHGTTCLYAALRLLDGVVLGTCRPKRDTKQFVRFLDQVEQGIAGAPEPVGRGPAHHVAGRHGPAHAKQRRGPEGAWTVKPRVPSRPAEQRWLILGHVQALKVFHEPRRRRRA